MAKTSMTTLTLAINDQQARKVLESLKAQMESVKKTLEETQEKFKGERAWDVGIQPKESKNKSRGSRRN